MFEFLFRRRRRKPEEKLEELLTPETLEERLDREKEHLPSSIKNIIDKDPTMKERFIKVAKQMEADGVDMSSPLAMRKWAKENQKKMNLIYKKAVMEDTDNLKQDKKMTK